MSRLDAAAAALKVNLSSSHCMTNLGHRTMSSQLILNTPEHLMTTPPPAGVQPSNPCTHRRRRGTRLGGSATTGPNHQGQALLPLLPKGIATHPTPGTPLMMSPQPGMQAMTTPTQQMLLSHSCRQGVKPLLSSTLESQVTQDPTRVRVRGRGSHTMWKTAMTSHMQASHARISLILLWGLSLISLRQTSGSVPMRPLPGKRSSSKSSWGQATMPPTTEGGQSTVLTCSTARGQAMIPT